MEIYKNNTIGEEIRNLIRENYRESPIEVETIWIDSEEFGRTHVMAAGNPAGDPIVLLHGSSGNSTAWFGALAEIGRDYRVFMVDIPGQPGLSSTERPELNVETLSGWLGEVVTELHLNRFGLAGMSIGAWLALAFTIRNPALISGLALVSPSGIKPPRVGFIFRVLPLTFMGRYGQEKLFKMIHGPVPVYPKMLEFAQIISNGYKPMTEVPAVFEDDELSGIDTPMIFIGGAKDIMLDMPGSAERLKKLVQHCRIILRQEYSHVLPNEGSVISDFFHSI